MLVEELNGRAHRVVVRGCMPSYQCWSSGLSSRASSAQCLHLETGVQCAINSFADDTKLGGAVGFLKVQEALQRDLDRWGHWAITSGRTFKENKCWALQLEQGNTGH